MTTGRSPKTLAGSHGSRDAASSSAAALPSQPAGSRRGNARSALDRTKANKRALVRCPGAWLVAELDTQHLPHRRCCCRPQVCAGAAPGSQTGDERSPRHAHTLATASQTAREGFEGAADLVFVGVLLLRGQGGEGATERGREGRVEGQNGSWCWV